MRLRILAAALILPAALAAQQPAQPSAHPSAQPSAPSAADPMMSSFRAANARYAGWLATAFDSIPASKYGFRPTPKQQTVGYVAQHLEGANYSLCSAASGTTHAMTARDSLADSVKAMWPKDTLVARLRASLAFCDAAMAKLTDAQLADQVPAGPGGRTGPRARPVLIFTVDLVDHWSQMANYMRAMGMTPPSAYPRPRS